MGYTVTIGRWERRYAVVQVDADSVEAAAEALRAAAVEGSDTALWAGDYGPADGAPVVHGESILSITDGDDEAVCGFVPLTAGGEVDVEDIVTADVLQALLTKARDV